MYIYIYISLYKYVAPDTVLWWQQQQSRASMLLAMRRTGTRAESLPRGPSEGNFGGAPCRLYFGTSVDVRSNFCATSLQFLRLWKLSGPLMQRLGSFPTVAVQAPLQVRTPLPVQVRSPTQSRQTQRWQTLKCNGHGDAYDLTSTPEVVGKRQQELRNAKGNVINRIESNMQHMNTKP